MPSPPHACNIYSCTPTTIGCRTIGDVLFKRARVDYLQRTFQVNKNNRYMRMHSMYVRNVTVENVIINLCWRTWTGYRYTSYMYNVMSVYIQLYFSLESNAKRRRLNFSVENRRIVVAIKERVSMSNVNPNCIPKNDMPVNSLATEFYRILPYTRVRTHACRFK